MSEVLRESIAPHNLPFTVALGIVLLYWLVTAIGLGFESMDGHDGGDVSGDASDGDGDGDAHHTETGEAAHSSIWALKFLNSGQLPVTGVISLFVVFLWAAAISLNHYFNPSGTLLLTLGITAAACVISAVCTRFAGLPLKPLMRRLRADSEAPQPVIGVMGVVRTQELTTRHGQVEISRGGVPLLLNSRLSDAFPEPLPRGAHVVIAEYDAKATLYIARPAGDSALG